MQKLLLLELLELLELLQLLQLLQLLKVLKWLTNQVGLRVLMGLGWSCYRCCSC